MFKIHRTHLNFLTKSQSYKNLIKSQIHFSPQRQFCLKPEKPELQQVQKKFDDLNGKRLDVSEFDDKYIYFNRQDLAR